MKKRLLGSLKFLLENQSNLLSHFWIYHIVKDRPLAEKLASTKDKKKMTKLVEKTVTHLKQEKRHHEQVVEHGIKWGVREFGIGLATGLFVGFVVLRALGQV